MGGHKSVTRFRALARAVLGLVAGALITVGAPVPALAQPVSRDLAREMSSRSDEFREFYAARSFSPFWMTPDGRVGSAAHALLSRVETAQFDGLDRKALRRLDLRSVHRDLRRASRGDPDDVARADVGLSRLFAEYIRAVRSVRPDEMIYAGPGLAPKVPSAPAVLAAAGAAESIDRYVREMGWMHPLYAPLRDAIGTPGYSPSQRDAIWLNLARVRAMPALAQGRHVLVDTAGARLWMYEDGQPVDSMKVVVGKPETQTPTMAGHVSHAIVNPYWNVPPDLVQQNIATNVLDKGIGYLKDRGYEVLSDYSDKPALVDPKTVKWDAVAAGTRFVRVRQKPGNGNFMGKVKYEFPNQLGIYLHDTPDKHLLKEDRRQLSAGCVRLEDADRFGRWLLGRPLPRPGKQAEQRVEVAQPVPIYITHLTAMPTESGIAFRSDVYGETVQMASTAY